MPNNVGYRRVSPASRRKYGVVICAPSPEVINPNTKLHDGYSSLASIARLNYLSCCPALIILRVPETNFARDDQLIKPNDDSFFRAFVQDDTARYFCPQLEYFDMNQRWHALPSRTLRGGGKSAFWLHETCGKS